MTSGIGAKTGARTYTLDQIVPLAWSGLVRVPHFQRGFRWNQSDVVQLLDSIQHGYPIGNLLLWERPAAGERVQLGALDIDAPSVDQALWVVDGQQRLTSLANVLRPEARRDARFAMGFDVRSERVVPLGDTDDSFVVPLPVLFDLAAVLTWFAERPEAADGRDAAFAFARDLRQYTVPAYQVEHGDVTVLQKIFDRLNNSGKRLRRAEVFFALHAGAEGDRRLSPQRVAEHIDERYGFGLIAEDTVVQCVLARRGPDVQRDVHVEFDATRRRGASDFPDEDVDAAYERAEAAIGLAVQFMQKNGVPHYGMLPYRFLLVVLTRFLALHPDPAPVQLRVLGRWFWRAAVAGPVIAKGSTTGTTRALLNTISGDDANVSLRALLELVKPSPLPDAARFRTNDASGKIVTCWLWSLAPKNPETGEHYVLQDLTTTLAESGTTAEIMRPIFRPAGLGDRRWWAANRVLMPGLSEAPPTVSGLLDRRPLTLSDSEWLSVLQSHAVDPKMEGALALADVSGFLERRQRVIVESVRVFLELHCEWGFEATPPLGDLTIEDLGDDEHGAA